MTLWLGLNPTMYYIVSCQAGIGVCTSITIPEVHISKLTVQFNRCATMLYKNRKPILISKRERSLEISAVILTALGKFFFMDYLNWRLPFITIAIILWSLYVFYRIRTKPGIAKYWGFRTDNFKKVAKVVLPFGAFALISFFAIGSYQHTINFTWHIIPIMVLYPLWGIIQQYLLIALTVGNLQGYNSKVPRRMIVLFSAVLFGLIHYPFGWLMAATFILAIFYGQIYLKDRNLYVLGIFHGWLGGLFYYTVLNRDPFIETFGQVALFLKGGIVGQLIPLYINTFLLS